MARDPAPTAAPTATEDAARDGARTVTLTLDELRALTQPSAPAQRAAPTITEAFEAHQQFRADARAAAGRSWWVACVSAETGSRFVAEVCESRRYAGGRVVTLHGYEYPPGSDRSAADGGTCRLGTMRSATGVPTPDYRQWLYEFRRADLRTLAGADGARLTTIAPARPELAMALADLADAPPAVPSQAEPVASVVPDLVAREVA